MIKSNLAVPNHQATRRSMWMYSSTVGIQYIYYAMLYMRHSFVIFFIFLAKCSEVSRQPSPEEVLDIIDGTNKVRSREEVWR